MKINLGREGHSRKPFNFSHDISTTNNFGVCQPLITKELPANSSFNIRVGSACRLMPLVKPTFGSVELKTFLGFVPYEELFHPFASMLANKPYTTFDSHMITNVPHMTFRQYLLFTLAFARVSVHMTVVGNAGDTGWTASLGQKVTNTNDIRNILNAFIETYEYRKLTEISYFYDLAVSRKRLLYNINHDSIPLTPEGSDFTAIVEYNGQKYLLLFVLSKRGRQLRNLMLGCGGQLCYSTYNFNFLNLVAHYKFYFDTLVPQREITWKDTKVYSLIEFLEITGSTDVLFNTGDTESDVTLKFDAFDNMADMYYYQGTDFISAHITGTAISNGALAENYMNKTGTEVSITASRGQQPSLVNTTSQVSNLTQSGLNLLQKLTSFVNKNTILGGKIDDFLRVHGYGAYLDEKESNFIGVNSMPVEISDVMSTADTFDNDNQGSILGEYAGKGYNADSGQSFHFESKSPGVVVGFQVLVPRAKFVQGIDPNMMHVERFDFYTPQFDAVTLVPNSKRVVFGFEDNVHYNKTQDYDSGFGNIPLYSEYKVAQNKLLGEMSLQSKRQSFLPFTMDKLLPFDTVTKDTVDPERYLFYPLDSNILVNSPEWRSIGKYPWLGYYNRIFINSGKGYSHFDESGQYQFDFLDLDDNFIIHNYVDFVGQCPMIPIDSSFSTDPFAGETFKVEKQ